MNGTSGVEAQIEALKEELARIQPTEWNRQRIADRERQLAISEATLARIEAVHQRFLNGRAELLARCERFPALPRD